ncbi:hypothetical protein JCM25156A_24870 [Komagataeibacter kakiaceti JCM 25156]|uniref:hypothetical protein n=1 Tax=Komagataeibacter kakiaceti TaxID=943261 RepID=UPI0011DCF769|nr:hypothetical protein [Komagataeibacter kakiaceti]
MDIATVLTSTGLSLTCAGAGIIGAFKFWAQKTFENRLAKGMAELNAKNALEIERIKVQLSASLDRSTRFHTHEYSIYPDIWSKLTDAYGSALKLNLPTTYETLPEDNNKALDEILEKDGFSEGEKERVRKSHDKKKSYREIKYEKEFSYASVAYAGFHTSLAENSIFFSHEFADILLEMSEKVIGQLIKNKPPLNREHYQCWIDYIEFQSGCRKDMEKIQSYIREHISPRKSLT